MKKKVLGAFLCLVVLLVIIIAMAPAKTIWPFVADKLPKKIQAVQIGNISGSIWSPQIDKIAYQGHLLENISADVSIWNLLLGKLNSQISINDPTLKVQGDLSAGKTSINLQQTNFELDAQRLDPLMQFPVKSLSGTITGTIEQADFQANGNWETITGVGSWQNAAIGYLEESLELGNFNFELNTDENKQLVLIILDNDGVLDLAGTLTITRNKTYQIDVTTQQNLPPQIERWVKGFGRLQNNRYEIQWNGKL